MKSFPRSRALAALAVLIAFALATASLHATRARDLDGLLASDEPEWIAASVLHWRQLTRGGPPAGAELTPLETRPWRAGFQSTTFGAANPCVPKLVWGATLAAAGHREASPLVFQRFHRADPAAGAAARAELMEALPSARRTALAVAALCGALLFGIARRLAGLAAGVAALAAWLASPLVQRWATYLRPDFFMLAAALATLALALALRPQLTGRGGPGRQAAGAALLGVAAGLTIACKLNGAVVAVALLVWLPLLAWHGRRDSRGPVVRGALVALAAAVAAGALTVYALNPVLWSDPVGQGRSILEFWGPHMEFQQERAAAGGVAIARTFSEKVALAAGRALGSDEPWRAATGLPGGVTLIAAGVLVLGAWAGGRGRDACCRADALTTLVFIACVAGGTTLWLPLDWDRYFFPLVACAALLEAVALGALVHLVLRRLRARAATHAAEPDAGA